MLSWYPIVRWTKTWEKHPPNTIICLHCHSTLCFQATLTNTLIPAKRFCIIPTRQSFLWVGGPARWDFPQIGRHLGWLLWSSFHTSLWWWEGQRALFLLGILLSCRRSLLRSPLCQGKDIPQQLLSGRSRVGWGGGVAQGHCAVEGNMAAAWQLVKAWLCFFRCLLFLRYLCLKCHCRLDLTEHSWSKQRR